MVPADGITIHGCARARAALHHAPHAGRKKFRFVAFEERLIFLWREAFVFYARRTAHAF